MTSSRWLRALTRRTQKPFSSLWYVTRSTRPANTSKVDGSGALQLQRQYALELDRCRQQKRSYHRFAQCRAYRLGVVPMLDQRAPGSVQVYQMSANRIVFENETMQRIAVMHLGTGLLGTTQLGLQQIVQLRRVRLACHGFHDLADEESE